MSMPTKIVQETVVAASPLPTLVCAAYSDMEHGGNQRQGEVLLERLREYVHEQGEPTCVIIGCKLHALLDACFLISRRQPSLHSLVSH